MTTDQVRALIAQQLGVPPARVTETADLRVDLGADSLDQIELVMALEQEFGAQIPDEWADRWRTVADVEATTRILALKTGRAQ